MANRNPNSAAGPAAELTRPGKTLGQRFADNWQLIAKCQQGYVGVSTWWYIEEPMGDYAKDYIFLPPLTGLKGTQYEDTCGVTIRPGSPISSGQLNITAKCQSPINLLKFFDLWYNGETVRQPQYGPTDAEWQAYKDRLSKKCGLDDMI